MDCPHCSSALFSRLGDACAEIQYEFNDLLQINLGHFADSDDDNPNDSAGLFGASHNRE